MKLLPCRPGLVRTTSLQWKSDSRCTLHDCLLSKDGSLDGTSTAPPRSTTTASCSTFSTTLSALYCSESIIIVLWAVTDRKSLQTRGKLGRDLEDKTHHALVPSSPRHSRRRTHRHATGTRLYFAGHCLSRSSTHLLQLLAPDTSQHG